MKKLLVTLGIGISISFHSIAQVTSVDAGADRTICLGTNTQIAASAECTETGGGPTPPVDCQNCDQIISGTGNHTVNTGQKFCVLESTTYSGTVNVNGGTLVVCGDLSPSSINLWSGSLVVIGTATFSNLSVNGGSFENYGSVTINGSFTNNVTTKNFGTVLVNGNTVHNNGTFEFGPGSLWETTNVTINTNVTGDANTCSQLKVSSNTTINNGTISGMIDICDANGIETNWGTLGPDVTTDCSCTPTGGGSSVCNLTYSWSPTTGLSDPNISNPVANPAATTTYTVTVTDGDNNQIADQVTITVVSDPTLDAGPDVSICNGESTQLSATFACEPSTGPVGCTSIPVQPTEDCNNCDRTISGAAAQNINPGEKVCVTSGSTFSGSININGGTLVVCGTFDASSVALNGGNLVILGDGQIGSFTHNSASATFENYGDITIASMSINGPFFNHGIATINSGTNINGNGSTTNTSLLTINGDLTNNDQLTNSGTLTVNGNITINGSATLTNECTVVATGTFTNHGTLVNNGSITSSNFNEDNSPPGITYKWIPSAGLSDPTILNPVATPNQTTYYTLIAMDQSGIIATDVIKVEVCESRPEVSGNYNLGIPGSDSIFGPSETPPMKVSALFGPDRDLDDIQVQSHIRTAGIFTLHFEDENNIPGQGFDDPTLVGALTLGERRKLVVIQVFDDLSQLLALGGNPANLPDPYPADGVAPPLIDIEVTSGVIIDNSGNPLPNALAAASPFFLEAGIGISNGMIWKQIISGFDPYYNLNNTFLATGIPSPVRYAGLVQVNFDFDYYLDLTAISPQGATESDLYQTVLHESMHGLGFFSLVQANGTSLLTQTSPGLHSAFEERITRGGTPLIIDNVLGLGGNSVGFNFPAGLSTNPGCVAPNYIYTHADNTTNTIHTPGVFAVGGSFSHFNCNNTGGCPIAFSTNGFIMNNCTQPGPAWRLRNLHDDEVKTLCDLGYSITGVYGSPTNADPTTFENHPGVCPVNNPQTIVGINDFRPYNAANSGADFLAIAGTTMTFNRSDFLDNDIPLGAVEADPGTYELVVGNGQLAAQTSTGFDFTPDPAFSGLAIIKYRPRLISDPTVRAPITYIFVNVQLPPGPACNDPFNCDLLNCAGNMENPLLPFPNFYASPFPINTPDQVVGNNHPVFGTTATNSAPCQGPGDVWNFPNPFEGNRYGFLVATGNGANASSEALAFPTSVPLTQGHTYRATIRAQSIADNQCPATLEMNFTDGAPCPTPGNWTSCSTFTRVNTQQAVVNNIPGQWLPLTFDFTVPIGQNIDHLVIRNAFEQLQAFTFQGLAVDDLRLEDLGDFTVTSTISNPAPCPGGSFSIQYEVNLGPGAISNAQDIDLTINTPAGLTFNSVNTTSAGVNIVGNQVTINAGALTTSTQPIILSADFQANLSAPLGVPLDITFSLNSPTCTFIDPVLASDQIIIDNLSSTITVTPSVVSTQTCYSSGDIIDFSIDVTNNTSNQIDDLVLRNFIFQAEPIGVGGGFGDFINGIFGALGDGVLFTDPFSLPGNTTLTFNLSLQVNATITNQIFDECFHLEQTTPTSCGAVISCTPVDIRVFPIDLALTQTPVIRPSSIPGVVLNSRETIYDVSLTNNSTSSIDILILEHILGDGVFIPQIELPHDFIVNTANVTNIPPMATIPLQFGVEEMGHITTPIDNCVRVSLIPFTPNNSQAVCMTTAGVGPFPQICSSVDFSSVSNGLYFGHEHYERVLVPDNPNLAFSGDFTIECWIKVEPFSVPGQTDEVTIFQKFENNSIIVADADGFIFGIDDNGDLKVRLSEGSRNEFISGANVVDGNFHHVALVRESSGSNDNIRLFVDGVSSPTTIANINLVNTIEAYIGGGPPVAGFGGLTTTDLFISDMRVWNRALMVGELDQNLAAPFPADLASFWAMTEGKGFTLTDFSGNGVNGDITGSQPPSGCGAIVPATNTSPRSLQCERATWAFAATCPSCKKSNSDLFDKEVDHDAFSAILFPNPTSAHINLQVEEKAGFFTLQVYNTAGQQVYGKSDLDAKQVHEFGNDFAPGLYTVKVTSENEFVILRFVKE